MRKNKKYRKGVDFLYSTYEITGLNLDRFINTVKKRGIDLIRVKKNGNKQLQVSIKFCESEKFFAITKELCYNIKKIKDGGRLYPLLVLYRNLGVAIGIVLMFSISIFFSDYIFSIDFIGSGSVCKREIKEYLNENGVHEFNRFSQLDIPVLEDKLLASNDKLSFVSVKKRGNRLIINSVLSTDKVETLNGNIYAIYSNVSGVVDNIKVYRGTVLVEKGQTVNAGDLLVDGYAIIKDQKVKINVLASITIICTDHFTYRSNKEGEENTALLLATAERLDNEIIDYNVSVIKEGNNYTYTVSVRYRHVLTVG